MNSIAAPLRNKNEYVSAENLRALIKQNLGYNARQVTVSGGSSIRYLTVTVRDAAVDVAAVEAFAKSLDTWTMDETDYCEGQSINVKTTEQVDAAHAAPFIEEIKAMIPKVAALNPGQGLGLSNGKLLWNHEQGFYVTSDGGTKRGCHIWPADVRELKDYAVQALALQMARVGL